MKRRYIRGAWRGKPLPDGRLIINPGYETFIFCGAWFDVVFTSFDNVVWC